MNAEAVRRNPYSLTISPILDGGSVGLSVVEPKRRANGEKFYGKSKKREVILTVIAHTKIGENLTPQQFADAAILAYADDLDGLGDEELIRKTRTSVQSAMQMRMHFLQDIEEIKTGGNLSMRAARSLDLLNEIDLPLDEVARRLSIQSRSRAQRSDIPRVREYKRKVRTKRTTANRQTRTRETSIKPIPEEIKPIRSELEVFEDSYGNRRKEIALALIAGNANGTNFLYPESEDLIRAVYADLLGDRALSPERKRLLLRAAILSREDTVERIAKVCKDGASDTEIESLLEEITTLLPKYEDRDKEKFAGRVIKILRRHIDFAQIGNPLSDDDKIVRHKQSGMIISRVRDYAPSADGTQDLVKIRGGEPGSTPAKDRVIPIFHAPHPKRRNRRR